jgi:UDP-sulfoquinovose synthase|tara:strand:- start:13477 stop:14628 length:1152 start_codon:yes stop_codon:yes gene_type:complete
MRILILGGDGYLGWPTAMYLSARGHTIGVIDNLAKRKWEAEIGCGPLWSIPPLHERVRKWNSIDANHNDSMEMWICDVAENRSLLYKIVEDFKPDTIVHYAEQPSAPYSQMDAGRCIYTQRNNVLGTLNVLMAVLHCGSTPHIVKLGTMGEYGTPNIDIEEGWLDVEHNGRKDRVLYPKRPGSWYHLSKVHDSHNLEFACRTWGIRVTDLNQGIVYGTDTDETQLDPSLTTSFHYDAIFGTVINRFITQAIAGTPLTVYGSGTQTRGFLDIRDTLRCVELACENPAEAGEFRVMNQFTEEFDINDLAGMVSDATGAEIQHIENPRVEQEDHYYNASNTKLIDLGLEPHGFLESTIQRMAEKVEIYAKFINKEAIMPTVKWRQT